MNGEAIFFAGRDQRPQARQIGAHEIEHAQLLRQQAGGVGRRRSGRQRAAEKAVEDGERLHLRIQRLARLRDVRLVRQRIQIRHHARRDLVAVGADVGGELQRSEGRARRRRRPPSSGDGPARSDRWTRRPRTSLAGRSSPAPAARSSARPCRPRRSRSAIAAPVFAVTMLSRRSTPSSSAAARTVRCTPAA